MSWFDDMTMEEIDKLAKKIDAQGFDHVFQITRRGCVDGPQGVHAPEVVNDDEHDILVNGVPYKIANGKGWQALAGYSYQNSGAYGGPCMHASEFIGGLLAEDIIQMSAEAEEEGEPLLWVVTLIKVEPDDEEEDPFPAGWAILYRRIR